MATLPENLSSTAKIVWEKSGNHAGVGGVTATESYVVVSDRDLLDTSDLFVCYDAQSGEKIWSLLYPAPGRLDYGNTPRATPTIWEDKVILLGAFGDLHCVELKSGKINWKKSLTKDFGETPGLIWGTCSTPIVSDGLVIVNPGSLEASLVALDAKSGEVVWQIPGAPSAFCSLLLTEKNERKLIYGYDKETIGCWDFKTGERISEIPPDVGGDFHVPTPILAGEKVIFASENNGARLFEIADDGALAAEPTAIYEELRHDSHTPIVVNDRLFGIYETLHCVDVKTMQPIWTGEDDAFEGYASIIGSTERLLILSEDGEFVTVDAKADELKILDRYMPFDSEANTLAHPAIVGTKIYARFGKRIVCIEWSQK